MPELLAPSVYPWPNAVNSKAASIKEIDSVYSGKAKSCLARL